VIEQFLSRIQQIRSEQKQQRVGTRFAAGPGERPGASPAVAGAVAHVPHEAYGLMISDWRRLLASRSSSSSSLRSCFLPSTLPENLQRSRPARQSQAKGGQTENSPQALPEPATAAGANNRWLCLLCGVCPPLARLRNEASAPLPASPGRWRNPVLAMRGLQQFLPAAMQSAACPETVPQALVLRLQ